MVEPLVFPNGLTQTVLMTERTVKCFALIKKENDLISHGFIIISINLSQELI